MDWRSDTGRMVCADGWYASSSIAHKKPRPTSRSFRAEVVGQGCCEEHQNYNREFGFFAIGIEKFFSICANWHQDDRAKPLVLQYQTALDSVLESHPELQRCAVSCLHCRIRFLTHPRNAGRRNLRCPFGCRRHHYLQRSRQRSTACYQTADGKRNKKRLNGRRQRSMGLPDRQSQPDLDPQETLPSEPTTDALQGKVELRLDGVVLDESSLQNSPMLPYVRMVVSLIEGIEFRCDEIVRLLRQAMRQHSIAYSRRVDYVLGFLHQHPP